MTQRSTSIGRNALPLTLCVSLSLTMLACGNQVSPDEGPASGPPISTAPLPPGAEEVEIAACIGTMNRGQQMPDFEALGALQAPFSKDERRKILTEFDASSGAIQRAIQCVERFGPLPGGDVLLAQDSIMVHGLSLITGDEDTERIALTGMSYLSKRYPDSCFAEVAETFVETQGTTLDTDALARDCPSALP